jgi:hypothetical protein
MRDTEVMKCRPIAAVVQAFAAGDFASPGSRLLRRKGFQSSKHLGEPGLQPACVRAVDVFGK